MVVIMLGWMVVIMLPALEKEGGEGEQQRREDFLNKES